MQWLNGTYAGWFNNVHERSGHLFQGRFHAIIIEKEFYFAEVLRYVVLNPVRAAMVQNAVDYRWSSYRATAGLEKAPDWFDGAGALTPFGGANVEGNANYHAFVNVASSERLWDKVTNAIYLGTESWTYRMRTRIESKPLSTDVPLVQRAVGRPKMAAVVETVARGATVIPDMLRTRKGGALRRLAAWIGWHEGLLTLRSIAAALRLRSEGYVSRLIRHCEQELCDNDSLVMQLDVALKSLRV